MQEIAPRATPELPGKSIRFLHPRIRDPGRQSHKHVRIKRHSCLCWAIYSPIEPQSQIAVGINLLAPGFGQGLHIIE